MAGGIALGLGVPGAQAQVVLSDPYSFDTKKFISFDELPIVTMPGVNFDNVVFFPGRNCEVGQYPCNSFDPDPSAGISFAERFVGQELSVFLVAGLSITHIVVLSRYVCHGRYREDVSIRAI
ncbi:MAG: hypothetical protein INF75_09645 [Roseomonas sp.]|nr:hypothetical protein [Roseomonas sp.]MCA3327920.1 hypothetical protein [Roseomonas sp.]MCA3332252.1 hypothetical protein [Roseomonas sp.]MCA3335483.1 hypothetical protein [Roseomonas sp.]MCA3345637.1 hypothetical protein [Roseomonas sp.]